MDIITFGTGNLYGVATNDFAGNPLANPTPVRFSNLQDISADISFEEKMLYGSGQFPIGIGRGAGKIEMQAKTATVSAQAYGALFFGQTPAAGIKALSEDNAAVVPASPFQITATPPAAGTFVQDLGVTNATTAQPLTRVASAPTAGQYTVTSGGQYTFAAADVGAALIYNYEYSATSTTASFIALTNKRMGYMPFFKANLTTSYAGASITLSLNKCASNKFSLPHKNDDFSVPDFNFSAFADAAGNIGYLSFSQ